MKSWPLSSQSLSVTARGGEGAAKGGGAQRGCGWRVAWVASSPQQVGGDASFATQRSAVA